MPVKPHRGVMILIFSLLGCCIIFPILAWVMGSKDLKEMAAGRMDRSGEGLTKAGKIIGMIVCFLSIGFTILYAILFAIGAATFSFSTAG